MGARLRWTVILGVALVVGGVEVLNDTVLDRALPFALDLLVVVTVVAGLAWAFAAVAGRRIERLTEDVARRDRELVDREEAARALHRISVASASVSELDRILRLVVDEARDLFRADVALLLLARPDGSLAARARSGPADAFCDPADRVEADDEVAAFVRPDLLVVRLEAPVRRGDETIGLLVVGAGREGRLGSHVVETLGSLASLVAVAVENDSLQSRLRELAVVEERERIAREMHDGLAQVLGYVNTKSQAVEELLAAGRVPEARRQLTELAAAARSVYVDVREAILGLRSPLGDGNLVDTIRRYADRWADAAKVSVRVDPDDAARDVRLTSVARAEVFRIVQEALTNVRKHAAAKRVRIAVTVEDEALLVRIVDDGQGFAETTPADGETWRHVGMAAMVERAAAVQGSVDWRSAPGCGAEVTITVPVTAPEPEVA